MSIHDIGYRSWDERRTLTWTRWIIIAASGIRLVSRGTWLRRMAPFTWLPVLFAGIGFFVYEQSINQPEARRALARFIMRSQENRELAELLLQDPASARHEVWSTILMTFFRYPQAIVMVLVVGLIAPRLISYDLRSRAYLLYFSRPLAIWEYMLGKLSIVWFFLFLITTLPALLLYCLGVLLSPDWTVIYSTWDLPLRVLAASLVLLIPTASLALAYSSMTTESRFATLAWIATWIMGVVAYLVLRNSMADDWETVSSKEGNQWQFLSLYHVSGNVQEWIFGLNTSVSDMLPYLSILCVVTGLSLATIYYRLSRTLQA